MELVESATSAPHSAKHHAGNSPPWFDVSMKENKTMKKILFALCFSLAAATPAYAVLFSPDGSGLSNAIDLTGFSFAPSNTLLKGGVGPIGMPFSPTLLAQGTIAAGLGSGGANVTLLGGELTFQLSAPVKAEVDVIKTPPYRANLNPIPGGRFDLYFNPTPIANPLVGTGYASGTHIFGGTLMSAKLEGNSFSPDQWVGLLDQFGPDNLGEVMTELLGGSGSFGLDNSNIDWVDKNFFVNGISKMNGTFAGRTPFDTGAQPTMPSGTIVGVHPNLGIDKNNNYSCLPGGVGTGCDIQFAFGGSIGLNGPAPTQKIITIPTEMLALNLTGQAMLPLVSDPGNALPGSQNGFGFLNTQIEIRESPTKRSPGTAILTDVNGGRIDNGDLLTVDSSFDIYFNILITDIDPTAANTGPPATPALDIAGLPDGSSIFIPSNGKSFAKMSARTTCVADTSKDNYGCLPPVGATYQGHFDVKIPLLSSYDGSGVPIDINKNKDPDVIGFTLLNHLVGGVLSVAPGTGGTLVNQFNSTATLNGFVRDKSTDPSFTAKLEGITSASQQIIVPAVPEPGSLALLLAGALASMGSVRRQSRFLRLD
jgi:hypothetical protein